METPTMTDEDQQRHEIDALRTGLSDTMRENKELCVEMDIMRIRLTELATLHTKLSMAISGLEQMANDGSATACATLKLVNGARGEET
jgi:regulator of replication initiation timing